MNESYSRTNQGKLSGFRLEFTVIALGTSHNSFFFESTRTVPIGNIVTVVQEKVVSQCRNYLRSLDVASARIFGYFQTEDHYEWRMFALNVDLLGDTASVSGVWCKGDEYFKAVMNF